MKFKDFWHKFSQNKAAVFGLVLFIALLTAVIFFTTQLDYEADAITQNIRQRKLPPSAEHWFGTDIFGRDLFARVIFGAWYSLGISVVAILIGSVIGTIVGTAAAYFGGYTDTLLMRFIDIWLAIPATLMAIVLIAAFGSSVFNLTLALAIAYTPSFARISRSIVLPLREQEYIQAARAVGVNSAHIIFSHILPNALGPILAQATLSVSKTILAIAGLSFIGLGISAPAPEWGTLLFEGKSQMLTNPHLVIIPGIAIVLVSLAINLIGDGLRDVLDPRSKK